MLCWVDAAGCDGKRQAQIQTVVALVASSENAALSFTGACRISSELLPDSGLCSSAPLNAARPASAARVSCHYTVISLGNNELRPPGSRDVPAASVNVAIPSVKTRATLGLGSRRRSWGGFTGGQSELTLRQRPRHLALPVVRRPVST